MIIDKKTIPYVVFYEETIQQALQKINLNTKRLVYCISESGVLEGLVTDGDFRRWVVSTQNIDLQIAVKEIANKEFVFARDTDSSQHIQDLFSPKITAVPIVDNIGRLTAIAWQDNPGIRIGDFIIREDKPAFIIAEIGNNHNGSLDLAKHLIDKAAAAGANCAKFQLRDMEALYGQSGKSVSEDLGSEYTLDLLKQFQLTPDQMFEAFDHVKKCGLVPLCTPWDLVSLERLTEYGLEAFKISSPDLTNHELVRAAAQKGRPLILSTGMSLEQEVVDTVKLLRNENASFLLMQCNSTYPTPYHDINLAYMDRLAELSGSPVGYSGHERGYEVAIAAVARGAKVIEKHFTIDRNMEGNDHRVSLLPHEFSAMVDSIRNVEVAIGTMAEREITQGERLNREILAKSLVARCDISIGETITESLIDIRSPGRGLQPSRIQDLIGVVATREMKVGDVFFDSDIAGGAVRPRQYNFDRPWGIPVRYHDIQALTAYAKPDFVELHFSYRDLDLDVKDYFESPLGFGLVVHSPELFAGDHLMDLSSLNEAYRARSISELQRVVDRTRELKEYFPSSLTPMVIINAGGHTSDRFMSVEKRQRHYDLIGDAFAQIDSEGVELLPQTMPPFPWHFGGQRFHNLFVDPDEIVAFCKKYNVKVCFDISHSQLACNHFGWSMRRFVREVGPYAKHLHIVDAKGDHDEGLQIGVGDIDFEAMGEDLREHSPGVSFIPEIWQGHKNGGEGFWIALNKLESQLGGSTHA